METSASRFTRDHSNFGDGYSLKSRDSQSLATLSRYHDEPEADYDQGATELYRCIENKDWDAAFDRLETAPIEAKTWVSRREQSSGKIRWRLLPLHAVCIFRAPLALIEALIEVYRDGPQMKDDQGMLPIHLACRNGASKGVVLTLLAAFPDSINVRDRKGRLPLDLVETSNSSNKEAVFLALKRFKLEHTVDGALNEPPPPPPSISTRNEKSPSQPPQIVANEVDYEHRTALFKLVLKKDWKAVVARATNFPEEAATFIVTKGFNGNLRFLPLHKACVLQPTDNVITALLNAFPGGASSRDQDGWLPLHCACFYGANEKIVNALMNAHSRAAQVKDDEGRLPLHYACLKGASQAVVDILLASYGKAAMSKDDEGRLPIHHACSKGAPESIVESLLKASPKGTQSKDDQGRLPLHHACRKIASERVIRSLIRVYPRAAQIKDDQDKLPIHYACHQGGNQNVITLLVQTYPESVNVPNGFGFTPLAEVKALNNPKMDPIIKTLEKVKKEQDRIKLTSGENATMESKVTMLEEKLAHLEKTLGKVTAIGKEMQSELKRKKDPVSVLEKFSEALIDLGNRSKTPLKTRNTTPSKGLFGLGRSVSTSAKAK